MPSKSSDSRHAVVNHSNRPSAAFAFNDLNCRPFLTEKLRPSGRERRRNSIQDLSVRTCTSSPARRRAVPGYSGLGPPDFVPHSIFGLRAVESRQFKFEKASRYATKVASFWVHAAWSQPGPQSPTSRACPYACGIDHRPVIVMTTGSRAENFCPPSNMFLSLVLTNL